MIGSSWYTESSNCWWPKYLLSDGIVVVLFISYADNVYNLCLKIKYKFYESYDSTYLQSSRLWSSTRNLVLGWNCQLTRNLKKNIKSIPVFELSCRQILDGKFKVMTSTPFLWEQLLTIDNCLRLDMGLQWNTCSVSHMLHRQFVLDYYRNWLVCLIWFCVYCLYSYNCFKELKYFLGPIGQ